MTRHFRAADSSKWRTAHVRAGVRTRYCSPMRYLIIGVGAALSLAAVVAGCGSGDKSGAAQAAKHTHPRAVQPEGLSPGMVAGVAPRGAGPSLVQLKFELQGRPQVAQPVDVDVAIVPVFGNVDRITGKISADDGLDVVSGQDIPVADKPVEGTPIHHSVKVLPKRDGIFTLTATLVVDSAGQSTSQTFSMPVISGAGVPDEPAKAPSADPAPTGAPHPAAAGQ
jgi:hypothetical protein